MGNIQPIYMAQTALSFGIRPQKREAHHTDVLTIVRESHTFLRDVFNLLKPTGYVMHQQLNIQQLYVLPTLYLCVLYLYENKQRLVPLTA